jgi:regulatory protein
MYITSLKTGTQDGVVLFKIGLSDGSSLQIEERYLIDHSGKYVFGGETNLLKKAVLGLGDAFFSVEAAPSAEAGKEISVDEEEILRFADACYRAERIGMRLIARAEQTQAGLTRKLETRGYASECVSAVMAHFVENDLINDERYAERWLRSRLARQSRKISGPRRLYTALMSRGINREALKRAFDRAFDEETEFALLQRFLFKNRKDSTSEVYFLRARLKYEGFSPSVINRYFDEVAD